MKKATDISKPNVMQSITYQPIGLIHTPFRNPKGTPIQPEGAGGAEGTAELYPQYAEGLKDMEGFSHVILFYHFHLSVRASLQARPFMDEQPRGIFAMRGPARPNAIGLSVVQLLAVRGTVLYLKNVDILDETPLLDIKPYVPRFDQPDHVRIGWLEQNVHKLPDATDDGRFSPEGSNHGD